jgi:hypothetical protein
MNLNITQEADPSKIKELDISYLPLLEDFVSKCERDGVCRQDVLSLEHYLDTPIITEVVNSKSIGTIKCETRNEVILRPVKEKIAEIKNNNIINGDVMNSLYNEANRWFKINIANIKAIAASPHFKTLQGEEHALIFDSNEKVKNIYNESMDVIYSHRNKGLIAFLEENDKDLDDLDKLHKLLYGSGTPIVSLFTTIIKMGSDEIDNVNVLIIKNIDNFIHDFTFEDLVYIVDNVDRLEKNCKNIIKYTVSDMIDIRDGIFWEYRNDVTKLQAFYRGWKALINIMAFESDDDDDLFGLLRSIYTIS